MNDCIVFTNTDGSCGVLIPTGEISIDEVESKDVPADATNVRQITTAELPADRLFRNAWDDSNIENFIGIDLVKAKVISHEMRRTDRDAKMQPLDKETAFVSTLPPRQAEIVNEKQTILDVNSIMQTDIDAATDEAELRLALAPLMV